MSTKSTTETDTDIIKIDWSAITPGEDNARKFFDPARLVELRESIKEHGLLQNISVTEDPEQKGRFILCGGERRWRATGDLLQELEKLGSKSVQVDGKDMVAADLAALRRMMSCKVVPADKAAKAFEIGLVENLQRENITPLEEAEAYHLLTKRTNSETGHNYTFKEIAQKVGKLTPDRKPDESYVTRRLKLRNAPDFLLNEVNAGAVGATVAECIGRIPDEKAREEAAKLVLKSKEQEVPLNLAQTKAMIQERFMNSLRNCGFDTEDADLVPVEYKEEVGWAPDGKTTIAEGLANAPVTKVRVCGGSCSDCPFRSGNNEDIKGEIAGGNKSVKRGVSAGIAPDLCMNPACFRAKQNATWQMVRRSSEAKGQKCIDGKAAEKIFSGKEGNLADDSGYARPEVKPYGRIVNHSGNVRPWGEYLKQAGLQTVVVRNPHTQSLEQLVPIKEVVAEIRKNAGKKKTVFDPPVVVKKDPAKEAAEKAKQEREQKVERFMRKLLFGAFAEKLDGVKPGDAVLGKFMVELTLGATTSYGSGVSGLLTEFCGITTDRYVGADMAWKAIEKRLAEDSKRSPQAWLKWMCLVVLGRGFMHTYGSIIDDDDAQRLAKILGVDIKKLQKQAEDAVPAVGELRICPHCNRNDVVPQDDVGFEDHVATCIQNPSVKKPQAAAKATPKKAAPKKAASAAAKPPKKKPVTKAKPAKGK